MRPEAPCVQPVARPYFTQEEHCRSCDKPILDANLQPGVSGRERGRPGVIGAGWTSGTNRPRHRVSASAAHAGDRRLGASQELVDILAPTGVLILHLRRQRPPVPTPTSLGDGRRALSRFDLDTEDSKEDAASDKGRVGQGCGSPREGGPGAWLFRLASTTSREPTVFGRVETRKLSGMLFGKSHPTAIA